jgi:hypothetical protein
MTAGDQFLLLPILPPLAFFRDPPPIPASSLADVGFAKRLVEIHTAESTRTHAFPELLVRAPKINPQSIIMMIGPEKETHHKGWSTVLITTLGSWGKKRSPTGRGILN